MSGISILIDGDFTERTGDWIWRLPHCKGVWKSGEAKWCVSSATEIIDHLSKYRAEVIEAIRDRLGPHGFDGPATIDEWISALSRVRDLAGTADGECCWIAGEPTQEVEDTRRGILAYLDKNLATDP